MVEWFTVGPMRRPISLTAVLGTTLVSLTLGVAPALAAGSASTSTTPTSTTPTPTTTTPSTTSTPAVDAHAHLYLSGAFRVSGSEVTVTGRAVQVRGFVRPFVAGQWVLVKSYVGKRLLRTEKLRVKPDAHGRLGAFTAIVRSPTAGILHVQVTHARTTAMLGFFAERGFSVIGQSVNVGATGTLVKLVQQRLSALHFYIPQTGVFDQGTQLALDAYHRLLGWGEGNQSLDSTTINDLLDGKGTFVVRFGHQGRHAEGDLTHQVLALIDGSQVQTIYPISSGKPSTPTILGSYRVYYRVPGYLPDGMYYSDFFISGYAIHGYDPAPTYPASHGCMRMPIVDAISAFNWLAIGDWVDTYYR